MLTGCVVVCDKWRRCYCYCRCLYIRSCGQVFCGDCSDYSLPVPQQHLDKPVRVCFHCFRQASASSDIPSAAATGNQLDSVNGGLKSVFGLSYAIWWHPSFRSPCIRAHAEHWFAVLILQLYMTSQRRVWCHVRWITENIYDADYDDSC